VGEERAERLSRTDALDDAGELDDAGSDIAVSASGRLRADVVLRQLPVSLLELR